MAPDVTAAFKKGLFTVNKSRKFSAIAIDQTHEQSNAMVMGEGGAVDLTENPGAFHRWMLSGPIQMDQWFGKNILLFVSCNGFPGARTAVEKKRASRRIRTHVTVSTS